MRLTAAKARCCLLMRAHVHPQSSKQSMYEYMDQPSTMSWTQPRSLQKRTEIHWQSKHAPGDQGCRRHRPARPAGRPPAPSPAATAPPGTQQPPAPHLPLCDSSSTCVHLHVYLSCCTKGIMQTGMSNVVYPEKQNTAYMHVSALCLCAQTAVPPLHQKSPMNN